MEAFDIEADDGCRGVGRYAAGLLTLPDGVARGVETIVRLDVQPGREGLQRTASAVAGSFREALGAPDHAPARAALPWRLAVSTMRAGFGAIEEGLRPRESVRFADGATVTASMSPEAAALIRRDAEIARSAVERAGHRIAPVPDTAPDAALTSIFRYEKRNGRLRRVPAGKSES